LEGLIVCKESTLIPYLSGILDSQHSSAESFVRESALLWIDLSTVFKQLDKKNIGKRNSRNDFDKIIDLSKFYKITF